LELVSGLAIENGRISALAVNKKGELRSFKPSEFVTRGLPKKSGLAGYSIDIRTSLKGWKPCSLHDYARAFELPTTTEGKHTAWTFSQEGRAFVVPALALIRTFVGRRKRLYSHLFKPQSLDDICSWDDKNAEVLVPSEGIRRPIERGCSHLQYSEMLAWMFCFPSARRAWASVYQGAVDGRLHVHLPKATVDLQLKYRLHGGTGYVFDLKFLATQPNEAPFEFAARCERRFEAINRFRPTTFERHESVTDSQWAAVAPILVDKSYPASQPRTDFDTMLLKQREGLTWKEAAMAFNANPTRVASLHLSWTTRGKLQQALAQLAELTKSEQGTSIAGTLAK